MTSSFRAINWSPNELLGESKTEQMADNAEWLYQNTPRALYTLPGGIKRVEGTKIAAGRAIITKTKKKSDSQTTVVRFGNFFSSRCEPIITTGIVSERQTRIFCVVSGIGRLQPDYSGFNISVNIAAETKKNDRIASSFYVAWQAMGY